MKIKFNFPTSYIRGSHDYISRKGKAGGSDYVYIAQPTDRTGQHKFSRMTTTTTATDDEDDSTKPRRPDRSEAAEQNCELANIITLPTLAHGTGKDQPEKRRSGEAEKVNKNIQIRSPVFVRPRSSSAAARNDKIYRDPRESILSKQSTTGVFGCVAGLTGAVALAHPPLTRTRCQPFKRWKLAASKGWWLVV